MSKNGLFKFKTLNISFFSIIPQYSVLYPEKTDFSSIFQARKSYLIFVRSLYQGDLNRRWKIMNEEEEWDWEDEKEDEEEEDW